MILASMTLTLNGRSREVPAGTRLVSLLDDLGIDRRLVAVALNGDVLARERYDEIVLREGDNVEVVRMVGGG